MGLEGGSLPGGGTSARGNDGLLGAGGPTFLTTKLDFVVNWATFPCPNTVGMNGLSVNAPISLMLWPYHQSQPA